MRTQTSIAVAGLAVCVCVAAAVAARTGKNPNPVHRSPVTTATGPSTQTQPAEFNKTRATGDGIRPNLFGDPIPVQARPSRPVKPVRTVQAVSVEPSAPADPLAKYVVTGLLHNEDGTVALLEDKTTRVGRFVHVGDNVDGAEVTGIDSEGIHFGKSDGTRLLAMNDKYDLTPFDRDAAYLGGRLTKHDGENPDQPVSLVKASQFLTSGLTTSVISAKFGNIENFKKLNDKAFEGKVPLPEYHQRVNAANTETFQILSYDNVNTIKTNTSDNVELTFKTTLDSK